MPALFSAALVFLGSSASTENAIANGDTRTLSFHHMHTGEDFTITFKKNGYYDDAALEKLNWGLRDWRLDEPTKMDPRLFDIVWEVYRESGSAETIHVVSAYRSPQTNAMLRRRSHQVAEHSQHMLGKAMDFFLPDVAMSKIREIGLRLQRGGVGFYPNANTVFVHLDAGGVRYWPRMSREQLSRVFPDGKTVLIPTDGQPMPGYQEALAAIEARGGTAYAANDKPAKGLFAWLFGGNNEEEDDAAPEAPPSKRGMAVAKAPTEDAEDGATPPHAGKTVPPAKPVVLASLESKNQTDAEEPTNVLGALALTPLPPARPSTLQQFSLNGPLPPSRPVELAALAQVRPATMKSDLGKSDPISQLLAKSDGAANPANIPPALIPQVAAKASPRPNENAPAPTYALAYAAPLPAATETPTLRAPPAAAPAPVRALIDAKPSLVAAQLNRTALQGGNASLTARHDRELAGPATGLRQIAQRKNPDKSDIGLVTDQERIVSSFGSVAALSPLSTDHFSGVAVKALTPEDGFQQLVTATN